ncbi:MAG: DUF883 family protein [Hyphomicrobiaceae bacterium]|nr:DUF883 family protein [Hyphomicrobiaceae bacterium]
MAEPYSRNDPATASSSAAVHRTVRVTETGDEHTTDYQAEIERLRSDMARLAESVGGSVRSTVRPMARELEATVARNPTTSIAIAAGVGLLLGLMMSRR